MDLELRIDHQLLAVQQEATVHAMLQLRAPEAPSTEARTPLSLAVVIDRSGSMSGDRLEYAKACVRYLAQRMAPTDELAVVVYDDEVNVVLPLGPVNPTAVRAAIGPVYPGGSTNLSGGWLKGMEILRSAAPERLRRVVLLTDGQANVGITEPGVLTNVTREAAAEGISTTTVGFGADFDEVLLTSMSDAGGGGAHFAETPDAAPAIFTEEFEGLVSVVAQNVSVEIWLEESVSVLGVLNEYPMVWQDRAVQVELGDAYGGELRAVVFEMHIPALGDIGPAKVADVVLRYVSVGDQVAAHEVKLPFMVNVGSPEEAKAAGLDQEVVEEVLILQAAKARDEARKRFDAGDFEGGRATLRQTSDALRKTRGGPRSKELLAQAEALEQLAGEIDQPTYSPMSSKQLHYQSNQIRRTRRPRPTP